MFAVTFELLGMLGRTLHVRNRCFRYLPNPSIFPWAKQSFALRRLLDAFSTQLSMGIDEYAKEHSEVPLELKHLNGTVRNLNKELPRNTDNYTPEQLNLIHDALDTTDQILSEPNADKEVVLDIVRRHFQEVLLAINTSAKKAEGHAPPATPILQAAISFDDLLNVPRSRREAEFMRKYFVEIRPRVISTDITGHHDTQAADESRAIHRESIAQQEARMSNEQQRAKTSNEEQDRYNEDEEADEGDGETVTQMQDQEEENHSPRSGHASNSNHNQAQTRGPRSQSMPRPINTSTWASGIKEIRQRVGTMKGPVKTPTWATTVTTAYDLERNYVWCALVFRMLCWLLLHDFDKKDVQRPKSELMGSRLPVYIM
jgi:hypothetical protein